MLKVFARWIVPGLVVAIGGTALTVFATEAEMTTDLQTRSVAALGPDQAPWAELQYDGRDVVLSGTAADQADVAAITAQLTQVHGVRTVTSAAEIAPLASPYAFSASIADGVVTLDGAIPSENWREALVASADAQIDHLHLRSGVPDRSLWSNSVAFALESLKSLDAGQVSLTGSQFSLHGRAKSERAYGELLLAFRDNAPADMSVGQVDLQPPLASPYEWAARSDGQKISITGFVPDDVLLTAYRAADVSGLPVATGVSLASGAPAAFAQNSQLLLTNLARLEYGSATIIDGHRTLTGAAATPQIAQAILNDVAPSGAIVVLEPPQIADYRIGATISPDGKITFDGYVPDELTRETLGKIANADTKPLTLGRGAPAQFQSAVDFAVSALQKMSDGRFELAGKTLTLKGIARTGADYDALLSIGQGGAPQGFKFAAADIAAPVAAPFVWKAEKQADGTIEITGFAPDAAAQKAIAAANKKPGKDQSVIASGEPKGFVDAAVTGLALLNTLSTGSVAFDGTGWVVTGVATDAAGLDTIKSAFAAQGLQQAGWSLAVTGSDSTVARTTPYVWSATRTSDGATTLTGLVPTDNLRRFQAVRAGKVASDTTAIDPDAPKSFIPDVLAGLDALNLLQTGTVSFNGTKWLIAGALKPENDEATVEAALATAATPVAAWRKELVAAPAAAKTQPEPEPEPAIATADADYVFGAVRGADGKISFTGAVPADAAKRFFAAMTASSTDALAIAPNPPQDFITNAEAGVRLLLTLEEGKLALAGGKWQLTGKAASQGIVDTVTAAIKALPGAANWTVDIASPPPTDVCRADVAQFSANNTILFQSGAARIAEDSLAALDELAKDLAECPEAVVQIEGHTDGDGDAAQNLALSVARAEAVIDALVQRNILAARLYAVGYGESQPIASNDTAAGKRQNRRIVVTVLDQHY